MYVESGCILLGSVGWVFELIDIEVGLDGVLYVLSWGYGYGVIFENGE